MPQYEMTTERLVGIIHSIKLEQKSGVLTARRGEDGMLEEGTVVFVNGRMTQASVGRRSGSAALNWLCTWGHCRYIFLPSTAEAAQPDSSLSAFPDGHELTATNHLMGTQRGPDTGPVNELSTLSLPVTPPPQAYVVKSGAESRVAPAKYRIVPRSIKPLQEVLRLIDQRRLSRSHRQLFLLINGQRTLEELMHLVGKDQFEIHALLRDLEDLGVIYVGGN